MLTLRHISIGSALLLGLCSADLTVTTTETATTTLISTTTLTLSATCFPVSTVTPEDCPQPIIGPSFEGQSSGTGDDIPQWWPLRANGYSDFGEIRAVPGTGDAASPPAGAHSGDKVAYFHGFAAESTLGSYMQIYQIVPVVCEGATYRPSLWMVSTTTTDFKFYVDVYDENFDVLATLEKTVSASADWEEVLFDAFLSTSTVHYFYLRIESTVPTFSLWLDDVTYSLVV